MNTRILAALILVLGCGARAATPARSAELALRSRTSDVAANPRLGPLAGAGAGVRRIDLGVQ